MRCVREPLTARDVASRRLLRRRYPPGYFPVVEPIDGIDRNRGDIIKITSIEGPGTGCDERPMWIRETTYDPNIRRVTHICRDLTDILGSVGEWAAAGGAEFYDDATEDEQESEMFWSDDDDTVPTEGAEGGEWR
jgi:hypothetical protein